MRLNSLSEPLLAYALVPPPPGTLFSCCHHHHTTTTAAAHHSTTDVPVADTACLAFYSEIKRVLARGQSKWLLLVHDKRRATSFSFDDIMRMTPASLMQARGQGGIYDTVGAQCAHPCMGPTDDAGTRNWRLASLTGQAPGQGQRQASPASR